MASFTLGPSGGPCRPSSHSANSIKTLSTCRCARKIRRDYPASVGVLILRPRHHRAGYVCMHSNLHFVAAWMLRSNGRVSAFHSPPGFFFFKGQKAPRQDFRFFEKRTDRTDAWDFYPARANACVRCFTDPYAASFGFQRLLPDGFRVQRMFRANYGRRKRVFEPL